MIMTIMEENLKLNGGEMKNERIRSVLRKSMKDAHSRDVLRLFFLITKRNSNFVSMWEQTKIKLFAKEPKLVSLKHSHLEVNFSGHLNNLRRVSNSNIRNLLSQDIFNVGRPWKDITR